MFTTYLCIRPLSAFTSTAMCFSKKILFLSFESIRWVHMTGVCISCPLILYQIKKLIIKPSFREHSVWISLLLLHHVKGSSLGMGWPEYIFKLAKKAMFYKNLGLPVEFKFQINHKKVFHIIGTFLC